MTVQTLLKDKILNNAYIAGGHTLKVDSFLNHQVDPDLMKQIGEDLAQRFANENITKVLTVEASGIAPALLTALALNVPLIIGKRRLPGTTSGNFYVARVKSFTKGKIYEVLIAQEFLNKTDKVLLVDDFLANGNAVAGLVEIADQAGATIAGVGVIVEKAFQYGGKKLRKNGLRVESIICIENMDAGEIQLKEE